MAIYYGSNKINPVIFGGNKIGTVYFGTNKVYSGTPSIKYKFSGAQSTFPSNCFKIRQTSTYGSTVVYTQSSVVGSSTLNISPYLAAGNVCYLYNNLSSYTQDVVINGLTVATLAKQTSVQAQDGGHYDLTNISQNAVFTYDLSNHKIIITYTE